MKNKEPFPSLEELSTDQIELNHFTDNDLTDTVRIVAIGASAGGLEALKEFFNNVPANCELSFVIIQHLSPDYKSLMAELLAKNTMLPIYEITNGMAVAPGCVYLIPPKKNMTILDGKLMLVNKPEGQDLNLPIDIFFRSLAQAYKEKAIAIILSGTGSDGTSGARTIKEVGGMVMVQDPEQAKFDGMPKSALNTGAVDYTLPVEQLPAELVYFIEHPKISGASENQIEKDEETVNHILHQIRTVTNLDFYNYKRPTLSRRIARRISVNKFHNHKEYLDFIFESPKEVHILAREFLIGVTNFFRDSHAWGVLAARIIPDLVKIKKNDQVVKVWCVGTSTGEEAYSMAIMISEELERQGRKDLPVKIFATDLSNDHLDIGSKGLYSESIIANVSKTRLKKFFIKKGGQYQVVDALRRMVIFSQHNILRDPPFNKMDIAVCRNLLIYMQPEAQRKIIGLLHYSLNLNGTLFLGSSETLGDYKSVLEEIDRKGKIYQNIKPARTLGMEPLNYPDIQKLTPSQYVAGQKSRTEVKMADVMNEAVAEELGLAAVYVDETYNILHAIGEFKKFMELPDKGFSINLLQMLPENIALSVGTAIRKATSQNERILCKSMKIQTSKECVSFDLLVNPFALNASGNSKGSLLLFIPKTEQKGKAVVVERPCKTTGGRITELEEELQQTRLNLSNVVQEVEIGNEELQATNEELLAANEELQSTNEELQSVNEELHTVNAELQQKIEDLASLNDDMDNLLESTDIGTIFLDRDMRIRKFTPSAKEHFNLQDTDIHRPIHHFSNSFETQKNTFDRVQAVLDTGKPLQQELKTRDGKWFLKRITPFRNRNHEIDGAVMSFVDINELKQSETKIKESEKQFKALYDNAPDMFASFDLEGTIINCNSRMVSNLGYTSSKNLLGKHLSDLYIPSECHKVKSRLEEFKRSGKLSNVERDLVRTDGSTITVSVNSEILYNEEGEELYSICSLRDISEIKDTQEQLRDKNRAFEQLIEGTMAGYWDWMIQDNTEYLSPSFKAMFGYEDHEMENSPEAWQKIIHPEDLPDVFEVFEKHVTSKGKIPYDNQVRYFHKDGSIVWVYCRGKVIEWDENGSPLRMVGCHTDITPLKNVEVELYRSNRELEQFAYVASHDLQEPLNTITDFVKLFEIEYKGKLDDNAEQYLDFIIQAADRMGKLVKGVLGYSRIGKSKENVSVDCNTLLEEVKKDLEKRMKDTGTKLVVDKLPTIKGYPTELHSLFLNLLSNAIKFRKEDTTPEIEIRVKELDAFWKFSIQDNGIGIAEKNLDKVFNIFQRLNNLDSYEGTGIGLAQCKKIVELHGGQIKVSSKLEKGSQFNFTIKK